MAVLVGKLVQDGSDADATVSCSSFNVLCGPDYSGDCFDVNHQGKCYAHYINP